MERNEIIQQALAYYQGHGVPNKKDYFFSCYKEVQPFVFKDDGYYKSFFGDTIPAFLFPMEENFKCFAIRDGKVIDTDQFMEKTRVSFAPFCACDVWFYHGYGTHYNPPHRAEMYDINGKCTKSGTRTSEHGRADFIYKCASLYGFNLDYEGVNTTWFDKAKPSTDMRFLHLLIDYGWNNKIYIEYRFDDLLNMEISALEKDDVKMLEYECRNNPLLKSTLNFKVFKRPLTDIEKVECAELFFYQYQKQKRKRNYATRKY